jgi:hypothetical protein
MTSKTIRLAMLAALLAAATLALPNVPVEAQEEAPQEVAGEAPEAFTPSERLPVDSAVSFPVDI